MIDLDCQQLQSVVFGLTFHEPDEGYNGTTLILKSD